MRFVAEVKPSDVVSALSLLVAILSLSSALIREARAKRREAFTLRQQYFSYIENWARRVMAALSTAVRATELDPSMMNGAFFTLRHGLLTDLSALIDEGRWYFPNLKTDSFGEDKELAFQGYRQRVLDCVVESLRLVESFDYRLPQNDQKRRPLIALKREFASEIQRIVDPSNRVKEYTALVGGSLVS